VQFVWLELVEKHHPSNIILPDLTMLTKSRFFAGDNLPDISCFSNVQDENGRNKDGNARYPW
jgi:hypothetical protein